MVRGVESTSSLHIMKVSLLLGGRTRRWPITRVRGYRLTGVALVVGSRGILRGVVLWVVLTIILGVVLAIVPRVVLAVVQLWIVTRLHFLSVASRRGPEDALMGR